MLSYTPAGAIQLAIPARFDALSRCDCAAMEILNDAEQARLREARTHNVPWKKWGPYLSERQWGTVREDYSPNGDAWNYFSHDQARSRAYRWGEDGIAGISDHRQLLCFAVALWNGRDPILKERLFGLTNAEGNHGEDVKECYFYLDSTPTHSYMKFLYKYPHREFPYSDLVLENRNFAIRGRGRASRRPRHRSNRRDRSRSPLRMNRLPIGGCSSIALYPCTPSASSRCRTHPPMSRTVSTTSSSSASVTPSEKTHTEQKPRRTIG
jgi:hypothetical protein